MSTQSVDRSKSPQEVSLRVKLDGKLKQNGIYSMQIFTEDGMLGSARLRMN